MATNWVTVTTDDIKAMFGNLFTPQDEQDLNPDTALNAWLPQVIAKVRAAILTGNRVALSTAASVVPPEAKQHVVVLVAELCIVNTPRMVQFVQLQPMKGLLDEARQFLAACKNGLSVTPPSDPDTTTTPSGVKWGDSNGPGDATSVIVDMTVDSNT